MSDKIGRIGLGEISVKRIQGRFFLIEVLDEDFMDILKQNEWVYMKDFFINIEPWSEKKNMPERVAWIDISRIHCTVGIMKRLNVCQGYEKI